MRFVPASTLLASLPRLRAMDAVSADLGIPALLDTRDKAIAPIRGRTFGAALYIIATISR
jgi:hypothetical protein